YFLLPNYMARKDRLFSADAVESPVSIGYALCCADMPISASIRIPIKGVPLPRGPRNEIRWSAPFGRRPVSDGIAKGMGFSDGRTTGALPGRCPIGLCPRRRLQLGTGAPPLFPLLWIPRLFRDGLCGLPLFPVRIGNPRMGPNGSDAL